MYSFSFSFIHHPDTSTQRTTVTVKPNHKPCSAENIGITIIPCRWRDVKIIFQEKQHPRGCNRSLDAASHLISNCAEAVGGGGAEGNVVNVAPEAASEAISHLVRGSVAG